MITRLLHDNSEKAMLNLVKSILIRMIAAHMVIPMMIRILILIPIRTITHTLIVTVDVVLGINQ